MTQQSKTNMSNQQYDLVSVLYHALEGAQTYSSYSQDAQQQGDQELSQFFQKIQQQQQSIAQEAQQMLAQRLK